MYGYAYRSRNEDIKGSHIDQTVVPPPRLSFLPPFPLPPSYPPPGHQALVA